MVKKEKCVYQFKVSLEGINPAIWRRIQVPEDYTFWEFHMAIQDSMGWEDDHLHSFEITDSKTGRKIIISDETGDECFEEDDYFKQAGIDFHNRFPILCDENKACISAYFFEPKQKAFYEYDFGDSWRHKITLEKILPLDPGATYPRCLAGERSCPPEDCGGIWGYEELLEIMKDPHHEGYDARMEWLGDGFDPENFNPDSVTFDDPKKD